MAEEKNLVKTILFQSHLWTIYFFWAEFWRKNFFSWWNWGKFFSKSFTFVGIKNFSEPSFCQEITFPGYKFHFKSNSGQKTDFLGWKDPIKQHFGWRKTKFWRILSSFGSNGNHLSSCLNLGKIRTKIHFFGLLCPIFA